MIRVAFNGGELSPQVQMRADLDVFQRGCSSVENFDIGQAGGVTRRRGFRRFVRAQGTASRLFSYKYSNSACYLVEVGELYLRVYSRHGELVWQVESAWSAAEIQELRTVQLNNMLLFVCASVPPVQLVCDADGAWTLSLYTYKVPAWRWSGWRDAPVIVKRRADGYFDVAFDSSLPAQERTPASGEALRVSYYTDAQEIRMSQAAAFAKVTRTFKEGFITTSASVDAGVIFAVRREPEKVVYSVVNDWEGENDFITGLIDPANYTHNFQVGTDGSVSESTISELTEKLSFTKGTCFTYDSGYWDIFTCVQDFVGASHYQKGGINPEDYPGHFVRGFMVGSAPCKGRWKLHLSGTWYGAYEVRASYEGTGSEYDDWESRAEAWSRNAAPVNEPVGGDEGGEECWVSLWLTRVRAYGDTLAARCFPADLCGNELVVSSYKHDLMLKYKVVYDSSTDTELDAYFVQSERVKARFWGNIETLDWSWCAWSAKYGFPRLAAVFNQRLVLAGTDAQPLTIWMSQTDDLDNFDITDEATSGMALTVNAETQDPIRWLAAQGGRIMLGTSEGEYVAQSGDGGVMTHANAVIAAHGFIGSANIEAVRGSDRIIYFERGGARVMQYGYDQAQDAYISTDLTVFADHVLAGGGGVVEGCFLRKPDSKAVLVMANGQLALMTYNAHHRVNAWPRYVTAGRFLSVAMLPNGEKSDSLFAVVAREQVREVAGGLADPNDRETVAWIEVCDENSMYTDGEGEDYTSTLLTNALNVTRLGSPKQSNAELWLYLHEPCPVKGVELTVDGGQTWSRVPRQVSKTMEAGWHKLCAVPNVGMERCVGFRCRGNQGMNVGALQA